MKPKIELVMVIVYLNIYQIIGCNNHQRCSDCFLDPKDCAWCSSNTDAFDNIERCLPRKSIDKSWCKGHPEIRQQSHSSVPESYDSNFSDNVLIKPQKYNVNILPGQNITLAFSFQSAKNYPVDLYILSDMSDTMRPYKDGIAKTSRNIYDTLNGLTNDVRLGFGAFVDKNTFPYTLKLDKRKTYSFKHYLNLTNDIDVFQNTVTNAEIGKNSDIPEGGFDALAQVLACEGEIGWRPKARRIVIFLTDAPQHVVGDGRVAGIFKPYDGQCYTNYKGEYTEELNMDYPSVNQINKLASQKGVTIIWTCPINTMTNLFEEVLQPLVRGSKAASLENPFSVANHLKKYYEEITTKINMEAIVQSGHYDKYEINFNPDCKKEVCKVKLEERRNFTVQITLKEDYKQKNDIIDISFDGVDDKLTLDIAIDGGCACEQYSVPNSTDCNNKKFECGVCVCGDEKYGHRCKCDRNKVDDKSELHDQTCIGPNKEKCSGNAGECDCGKCVCKRYRAGAFCEQDRSRCPGFKDGIECNNHGICHIKSGDKYVCECADGWQHTPGLEEAGCTCSKAKDACIINSIECNNRGRCECNSCICDPIPEWDKRVKQTGNCQISTCPECHSLQCDSLRACVLCHLEHKDNCDNDCTQGIQLLSNYTEIPEEYLSTSEWQHCKHQKVGSCYTKFVYKYDDENQKILLLAEEQLVCAQEYYLYGGILLLTLLLVGIFTLLAWKCLTRYQDRKEYEKFEREHKTVLSSPCTNPLYSEPRTFFRNPAFVASINGTDE